MAAMPFLRSSSQRALASYGKLKSDLPRVLKVLPKVTCLPLKFAMTATSGLKLGMRSGTIFADVKAAFAAARVEAPAVEHAVARSSREPSGRAAAVADATRARREMNCMVAALLLMFVKRV